MANYYLKETNLYPGSYYISDDVKSRIYVEEEVIETLSSIGRVHNVYFNPDSGLMDDEYILIDIDNYGQFFKDAPPNGLTENDITNSILSTENNSLKELQETNKTLIEENEKLKTEIEIIKQHLGI